MAKYPSDVPKQKAMKALRHLAQNPKYLKGMSQSGGISALVQVCPPSETRTRLEQLHMFSLADNCFGKKADSTACVPQLVHLWPREKKSVNVPTLRVVALQDTKAYGQ